jgi:hypothetical protein
VSIAGLAEATGLAGWSVDLATAGQAFHWFDRERTREELLRVLRPPRPVALVWNIRRKMGTPFLEAYEALLQRWSIDYREVDHERVTDDVIEAFFAPSRVVKRTFPNRLLLDLPGARGLMESASYVPAPGHERHASIVAALEDAFAAHAVAGRVTFEYTTAVYVGRLPDSDGG